MIIALKVFLTSVTEMVAIIPKLKLKQYKKNLTIDQEDFSLLPPLLSIKNETANIYIITICESASKRARKILYNHISMHVLKTGCGV